MSDSKAKAVQQRVSVWEVIEKDVPVYENPQKSGYAAVMLEKGRFLYHKLDSNTFPLYCDLLLMFDPSDVYKPLGWVDPSLMKPGITKTIVVEPSFDEVPHYQRPSRSIRINY